MVVEVPRYVRSPGDVPSGDGTYHPKADAGVQRENGGRLGSDGVSSAGSAIGMGVPAVPPPKPAASTPLTGKPLNLNLPRVEMNRYPGPVARPSVSELANAQLRSGKIKDAMAEAVNSAETPDCLKDKGMGLIGAPVAAYQAATGKCK